MEIDWKQTLFTYETLRQKFFLRVSKIFHNIDYSYSEYNLSTIYKLERQEEFLYSRKH